MKSTLADIQKLKKHLESAAFLVSKVGSEREAHGEVINSLIVLAQLESKIIGCSSDCETSNSEISVTGLRREECHSTFMYEEDASKEIKKVKRRLPRWFRNQNQNNSKILVAFLELMKEKQCVMVYDLNEKCNSVRDFYGNYNQMKNFGEKNHGKVFEEKDGIIVLWEPVKDFVLKLYNETVK